VTEGGHPRGTARRDIRRRRLRRYFLALAAFLVVALVAVALVLVGSSVPARAARRISLDFRLAAWFLWITPLAAARSIRRTATRMASTLSSVPASMALTADFVRVRISERTDLFLRRRRSF